MNPNSPSAPERPDNPKSIWVFTPSRTAPEDLEFILVQRQNILRDAVERVKESALTPHKHHLLFVGPRGCGKTHLVTLIVSRLLGDATLGDHLRIAWLNEDETCTTLLELLLKIHAALEKRYPSDYRAEMLEPAYDLGPDAAQEFVGRHLLASLGSRTLLVVTENLDALFDGLGTAGQMKLRAFIQENPRLSLVATAQRLVEDLSDRASPFFQTEHLKPLNFEQSAELLQNIARLQGKTDVVAFLATSRGRSRVRALHHLSGGNHRIYIVLSQFITRDSIEALVGPFMKMVDELTPYYQERVRWLPPLQRKIVEYLCACEGTAPVKEIAKKLFATPQTISSQLQELREKGYVEASQRGRESLYEMSEPLMRICVEVKDSQNHQPLRLLVDFLRVWYDDADLNKRLGAMERASASRIYLEAALQRNQAEGMALGNRALTLSRQEDSAAAITDFTRVIELPGAAPEHVATAHINRGVMHGKIGDSIAAIADYTRAIRLPGVEAALVAKALGNRGTTHYRIGDCRAAIADFTQVVEHPRATSEQVAMALVNRGITYRQCGDNNAAIEDWTRVLELSGAPPVATAMALVNRGVGLGQKGNTIAAIADFTSVLELPGAPLDQVAMALVNRGLARGLRGDSTDEITDYTRAIDLPGAPSEQVATALLNRGIAFGQQGDRTAAIADYTRAVRLPGAAPETVAMALVNRGFAHGQQGDRAAEIVDYTSVLQLHGAPPEQVAMALVNRGIAHGLQGDIASEIDDYTRVLELPGAPRLRVAMALVGRALGHSQRGDATAAIADHTRLLELPGIQPELVAMALINRGLAHSQLGDFSAAITDYTRAIELPGAPPDSVADALTYRGITYFRSGQRQETRIDFETVVHMPNSPGRSVVDGHFSFAELHWSEGRWAEGFTSLEAGLQRGAVEKPPYRNAPFRLVGVIFSAGLNPEGRLDKVATLLRSYAKYEALPVLGEAVVQHIGSVFRSGEPFPSTDNLEQWTTAWAQAAATVPDFSLSCRLLRTGVDFVKAGGKNPGILLTLTSAERAILRQALGLPEASP